MALPDLTSDGELPVGVHRAGIEEVIDRFGVGSDRRKQAAANLKRIFELAKSTNHLSFGSLWEFRHGKTKTE